jgi:GNAT superfamily N-acetyltransferase
VPLSAPEPISELHELEQFDCGVPTLNDWLKRRARANEIDGASRTFVVGEGPRIVAYYAIASGAISVGSATGRFRRNMPDPIPVALLARLAVDIGWQGQGIARALFRDWALRISHAAETLGIRGILVHAISTEAKAFYEAIGFEPSPANPLHLMVTLRDVRALIS